MYRPKALDVDKTERYFDMLEEVQRERYNTEREKVEAFNLGFAAAINRARGLLNCSNYEFVTDEDGESHADR